MCPSLPRGPVLPCLLSSGLAESRDLPAQRSPGSQHTLSVCDPGAYVRSLRFLVCAAGQLAIAEFIGEAGWTYGVDSGAAMPRRGTEPGLGRTLGLPLAPRSFSAMNTDFVFPILPQTSFVCLSVRVAECGCAPPKLHFHTPGWTVSTP